MQSRVILDHKQIALIIDRLCYQITETHKDFKEAVLIGVQPRGVDLAERLFDRFKQLFPDYKIPYGKLDITFYRDDFRRSDKAFSPSVTDIEFSIEGKNVLLIDDVLFTGRTIRSALDALLDFGRPNDVELVVLIDRRLQRHVPIQAKYIGKTIDSIISEKVKVFWQDKDGMDKVEIITEPIINVEN